MKKIACEMCGNTDLIKQDGYFVCQYCGCKYTVEEARKLMIEGVVEVQGTVKVDNSAFIEKSLKNARRALEKEDWEEVEKYYNLVEQNCPDNIEAVFFSSYGKAMSTIVRAFDENIRTTCENACSTLKRSISVISEHYQKTIENKKSVLGKISKAVSRMYEIPKAICEAHSAPLAKLKPAEWLQNEVDNIRDCVAKEFEELYKMSNEGYIQSLIDEIRSNTFKSGGCYVATCVYGSYDCPQVWTLRRYRDDTLGTTWYGRAFIKLYYAVSPTLVKWFGETKWFKKMWRGTLDRMVSKLQDKGVESTPYQDKEWEK
ncbi:MAG: TFIIB-type zinc finger domain-containing protein [Clostridia bacterium]|nr:TFIIB-type zinc finger domain-containing protein [Clostridia bacterium]